MKIGMYSKLVLMIIHIFDCKGETTSKIDSSTSNLDAMTVDSSKVGYGEYSYIVLIRLVFGPNQGVAYGEKSCTGTLIRNNFVMTLASCLLYNHKFDPDPDTVTVFERTTGRTLTARQIYINPRFYSKDRYISTSHDCGLILVVASNQTAFPHLPTSLEQFKDIKNSCIFGGYGNTYDKNDDIAFKVYHVNETAVEFYHGRACLGEVLLCVHFSSIVPCASDYGTPLVCENRVYAMYIPGPGSRHKQIPTQCLDLYITVFLPMYNLKEWVDMILNESTEVLGLLNNSWFVIPFCCIVFAFVGAIYYCLIEVVRETYDPAEALRTSSSESFRLDIPSSSIFGGSRTDIRNIESAVSFMPDNQSIKFR